MDGNLRCQATSTPTTITVITSPTAAFIIGGQLSPGETILFTNESIDAISWAWDFGDGASSTDKNPAHDYAEEGDYTVTLTAMAANGCQDITSQSVGIITGIEAGFLNEIKIYPNPVNEDKLLITTPGDFKEEFEVSILNIHGQRIKKSLFAGGVENVISVSDLSEGIYYVSIKSGNNKVAKKIIVQR